MPLHMYLQLSFKKEVYFRFFCLPHAHIVVTLHPNDKLMISEAIDKYISAEIPNNDVKVLQKLVIKHMLHGPHNENSPCCIKNKSKCS